MCVCVCADVFCSGEKGEVITCVRNLCVEDTFDVDVKCACVTVDDRVLSCAFFHGGRRFVNALFNC